MFFALEHLPSLSFNTVNPPIQCRLVCLLVYRNRYGQCTLPLSLSGLRVLYLEVVPPQPPEHPVVPLREILPYPSMVTSTLYSSHFFWHAEVLRACFVTQIHLIPILLS